MNAAYLHLTVNTMPIILNFVALPMVLYAMMARNATAMRIALVIVIATGLIGVVTYYSGQQAEEIVEELEGVNAVAIEPHEEAALYAYVLLCVEGVAAIAGLILMRRGEMPRWASVILLIVIVVTTATVLRTASLGGRIHHPEIEMER